MQLSQKEMTLLQDLKTQEQLCIEKYTNAATTACDPQLQTLFSSIGQTEQQHLHTLNQITEGIVPQISGQQQTPQQPAKQTQPATPMDSATRKKDKFLCVDALSMEKHVSSVYDTSIFEFKEPKVRDALNHIQKEEQQHGEQLYAYMHQNGMYS